MALTDQVNALATRLGVELKAQAALIAAKQTGDPTLTAIANLVTGANKLPFFAGVDTVATTDLTVFARSLLDDADAAAARATLVLGNVDNTSDANKPVSTAQAAADTASRDRGNHTGTQAQSTIVGLSTDLAAKAPIASPTFTGTVSGVTKAHVGLGSVDNTADSAKPVSTAQQNALNLKANLAAPALTGAATLDGQAIVKSNDARLSDARTPAAHTHTLVDLPDAWVKKSVRVATTANITLSGTQTIDGIAVVAGDRVLVKNQTNAAQNGLYVVAAGAWARAPGSNISTEIAGAAVNIDAGTQGGMLWSTNFKITDVLGTTAMNWYMIIDNSVLALELRKTDANIYWNGTAYPLRNTVTTDTARRVRWIGPNTPTIGGGYAINGLDVHEKRA